MVAVTVALSQAGSRYAVAKLIPLSDGGCSLIPAFNPSPNPGWLLLEVPTDYSRRGGVVLPRTDLLAEYRSDHAVKLSLHGGGFVQLSRVGEQGVLSGRDPVSRQPRALGFESFRITDPPRTGPMFVLTAWGLTGYPLLCPGRRALLVSDDDLYDESPDAAEQGTAFAFDFWPLPRVALPSARIDNDRLAFDVPSHDFYAGQPVRFLVIDIRNPLMVFGLVVTRFHSSFASPSGVTIASPSDRRQERALLGISPPPHSNGVPSADYPVAWPNIPPPRTILPVTKWLPDTQLARPWGRRAGGRKPPSAP